MGPLPVTPGGASSPSVTRDRFIRWEKGKNPSGPKKESVGEPPATSQAHRQAPRPDVEGIPLNLIQGAKEILSLGITSRPLWAPNFGATINKTKQHPNMNMLNGKHKNVTLSQAKHRGNNKNGHTWCLQVESPDAKYWALETDGSNQVQPLGQLNSAKEHVSRATKTHQDGVGVPKVQDRGVIPRTGSAHNSHYYLWRKEKGPDKAYPKHVQYD